jgi:hypothetical protein
MDFLFVLLLWVFYFLLLFLVSFFFLYCQLYHHHLLIPTLTPFTLPPSPMLKSIPLLPNNLFCPFSPTLSPCLTFPFHSPLTCYQTTPPSYTLITHWWTYYTNLHSPNHLQSLTQAPSTTTTEIHLNTHKDHKTQKTLQCFPYSPTSLPAPSFSATLSKHSNFYS